MNWVLISEAFGVIFAFIAIITSLYIMARVKQRAPIWIYLNMASFCMFFAMLLGVIGLIISANDSIQRLEQYVFFMAGALSFVLSGIKLHEMLSNK